MDAEDLKSIQMPGTGEKRPFAWETDDLRAGAVGHIPSMAVARAVHALLEAPELQLRGAREAALFRELSPAVVLIVTEDAVGTGSIILQDRHVVTNWHVVSGYETVSIIFKPASPMMNVQPMDVVSARILHVDEISDLALLEILGPVPERVTPIRLGSVADIHIGDDVHAIGHPAGATWTYTKGYVSQMRPSYEWTTEAGVTHRADVIQTQTPISPGSSGGPLINDDHEMIGINSFISMEGENVNFAVTIDELKRFIDRREDRFAPGSAREPAPCEVQVVFEGRSNEDDASVKSYDRDCDGVGDAALVVPDDQDKPIVFLYDDDQTGRPNGLVLDTDRDGKWDISFWDTDGDGERDLTGYHPDGKLNASSYEAG